jgi:hypothetical protein
MIVLNVIKKIVQLEDMGVAYFTPNEKVSLKPE